jgi:Zn-finger nucleic acid-binding protein
MTESLHCPNCGGAVESDKTQCEYCKARLKTVACPECLGLMFLGSKFCDSCGREAKSVEVIDDAKSVDCPRCKRKLESLMIDSIKARECTSCGGLWTDVATFESICSNKENQAAVLNLVSSRSADAAPQPAISYVPCPDCKQLMNRSNFARSSGVIVDLCKQHGVWFDRGELPKIIDFVDKGGLSRSREKEKIDLEDARDNLRDEQRKLALMERRTGSGGYTRDDDNSWGGVIAALFDL